MRPTTIYVAPFVQSKKLLTHFTLFSSVSVGDFEQLIACWASIKRTECSLKDC